MSSSPPPIRLLADALTRETGDRVLFGDLSLRAGPGLTWVRGASGTGKTELLRAVAGLTDAGGSVCLELEDRVLRPEQIGWPTWRTHVAYLPQSPVRFDIPAATVWQRVQGLAARAARDADDPRTLSARWGLQEEAWEQPLQELSGGEAQRIWLAIVLAGRPEVVLLDEPTAALDPATAELVERDLIDRVGLLVTHDHALGERLATAELDLQGHAR